MEAQLRKNYKAMLVPAAAGFLVAAIVRSFASLDLEVFKSWRPVHRPGPFHPVHRLCRGPAASDENPLR